MSTVLTPGGLVETSVSLSLSVKWRACCFLNSQHLRKMVFIYTIEEPKGLEKGEEILTKGYQLSSIFRAQLTTWLEIHNYTAAFLHSQLMLKRKQWEYFWPCYFCCKSQPCSPACSQCLYFCMFHSPQVFILSDCGCSLLKHHKCDQLKYWQSFNN